MIEAEVGFSRNSHVAVDDVIINLYSYTNDQQAKATGNYCNNISLHKNILGDKITFVKALASLLGIT